MLSRLGTFACTSLLVATLCNADQPAVPASDSLHAAGITAEQALLLDRIADNHDSNLEQIRTWRGEIQTESTSTRPPGGRYSGLKTSHRMRFVCDRVKDRFRLNSKCIGREVENGNVKGLDLCPSSNAMVLDDAHYEYRFDEDTDFLVDESDGSLVPVRRVAIVRPKGEMTKPMALDAAVHPLYWFTWRGKTVSEVFRTYADWAKEGEQLPHVSVERSGQLVSLRIGRGGAFNQYTVNLEKGATLVRFEADDGGSGTHEIWNYDYELVNGVWLPVSVELKVDQRDGRINKRSLQWIRSIVNEPIDDEEYSLVKLGLRRGDGVDDKRTGRQYKVQGLEYPPAAQPDAVAR